jgi:hypothetical protein
LGAKNAVNSVEYFHLVQATYLMSLTFVVSALTYSLTNLGIEVTVITFVF